MSAENLDIVAFDSGGYADVRHNPNRPLWTAKQVRALRAHYETHTARQIGQIVGRSVDAVKHKARELGLSLRKCGERCSWAKYSDALCEQARALHEQGYKIRVIQAEVGIPYHAVDSIIYFKRIG